ncbi:MAG TPA: flavin reductase family protein [Beijerinckiaceae bacterium]|jgi:flavin reductase (DIM6/NTAB) family NADH-FMN oxidoreductase RutF
MYYDALKNDHGLRYDPFKALVAPRPIGWVSTISRSGVLNLAPYSFFAAVAEKPAYVIFSASGTKDSRRNAEETGEFVCSLASYDLRHQMNVTSTAVPSDTDEFALAGLAPEASRFVKPPRVKDSPAALECRYWQTVVLPQHGDTGKVHAVVFGLVVGIFIDDRFVRDGIVDTGAMQPLSRLGYREYSSVTPETIFALDRPAAGNTNASG